MCALLFSSSSVYLHGSAELLGTMNEKCCTNEYTTHSTQWVDFEEEAEPQPKLMHQVKQEPFLRDIDDSASRDLFPPDSMINQKLLYRQLEEVRDPAPSPLQERFSSSHRQCRKIHFKEHFGEAATSSPSAIPAFY